MAFHNQFEGTSDRAQCVIEYDRAVIARRAPQSPSPQRDPVALWAIKWGEKLANNLRIIKPA